MTTTSAGPTASATTFSQNLSLFDPSRATSPDFQVFTALITPPIARRILSDHRAQNRRLNPHTMNRYRRDIEAGVWTFAGDPLRFGRDGLLIDGQHRLKAVAELENTTALPFIIMLGLDPEAISVMDQGSKRTAAQQLSLAGKPNSAILGGAVRLALLWDEGVRTYSGFMGTSSVISTPQIDRWVTENEELIDHTNAHISHFRTCCSSASGAMGAGLVLAAIDPAAEEEFFTALAEGGEPKGSPILALDKRFQRMSRDGHRYQSVDYFGMIFRAWNAWRAGETLTKIMRPSEMNTFPVPV